MKSSQWKENLADAVLELVLALVLCCVGVLVLCLLDVNWLAVDGETLMLIGLAVFAVLGAVGYGIYRLLKRKKKDKTDK